MRRACLLALSAAMLAWACGGSTEPLPLQVSMTASPESPTAGQQISFVVSAQGGALIGIIMEYGDEIVEQFPTAGARTARVTFTHAYTQAGTYLAVATLTDAGAGTAADTVSIVVR